MKPIDKDYDLVCDYCGNLGITLTDLMNEHKYLKGKVNAKEKAKKEDKPVSGGKYDRRIKKLGF